MSRPTRDIVVIGGSAGAIQVIRGVLAGLPPALPAAVLIVLHREADPLQQEVLTRIFASDTPLPAHTAHDRQPIEPGHVYVGPPDRHMLVENGVIELQRSPKEHSFRPCIDVLFKSAASTYGRRVIGVLLSGRYGNDGASGLWHISHRGGLTIVQDPADAQYRAMPEGGLENVAAHYVLPAAGIARVLTDLATGSLREDERSRVRILIVEDESVVATNLQQQLSEMGYEPIDWVPTGEAAIAMAEQTLPDLVLMDIRLAGALSGIETARRIWQTRQIPIVYCTAHADLDTLKAVQTTESYGYVVKPFQSGAIRAAIELALARREKELR